MGHFILKLYITGRSDRSLQAVDLLTRICEERLNGKYQIDLIDMIERPDLAAGKNIIVTPTVVREYPPPERRVIGDFSHEENVVHGLDLPTKF